ncbi:MAG: class I SAM-dependent methyltransferase [Nanoarchaeota archaeon]
MSEYDRLAKLYVERRADRSRFDYNRDIEVPALIKMVGDVTGKVILDMGCGFGDHAGKLKGYKRLIGFDISKAMVDFANRQNIPNATFYAGDMRKKLRHQDNSFDVVYSGLAIHYLNNVNPLFKEVNRVLKKGGIFCFSTGHPIFNLLNQTEEYVVGIRTGSDGKRLIIGDYFDESPKLNDLGSLGKVKLCNFTYETLINTGSRTGFELVEYRDAKPMKTARKFDPDKYRLTTTLPTFILFKFKKK